ncbi:DUF1615 domain-containing protein [Pseudomonas knackmussii]|uniref:DUF1615 domain-containing protein n=1 Tax=Pseudomonas knackmussii TaxID=65741 RepID=A0ABY4KY83_9PSED|nr:DUF1615 domain-containing protein [Pseudomonas knackmussii]UPQ84488.1 DUF1615 domain-containing protein [Pseudomonas knackmussii]
MRRTLACASALVLLGLAGCGTQQPETPAPRPDEVKAKIVQLIPSSIPDRKGWAGDIYAAFDALEITPNNENICSVLAVTVQESTFQATPPVPGLAKIAREEIYRRASRLHVPRFVVNAALDVRSPNGKTYSERLNAVRTEEQLSAIFDDFLSIMPLGKQLFGTLNPVKTGGPMQVSIKFAEDRRWDYPFEYKGSIRDEVFTRRGGMYFGIAHLLDYPASYTQPLYRFADFNAGWYASRNAAFQNAVARASGTKLALDGDLIIHGSSKAGQTERAVRSLAGKLDMSETAIRNALERGDTRGFEKTSLYERVFALAEKRVGKPLPRAVLPGIRLESPKITRNLTTAWFANRVNDRHLACMKRARG